MKNIIIAMWLCLLTSFHLLAAGFDCKAVTAHFPDSGSMHRYIERVKKAKDDLRGAFEEANKNKSLTKAETLLKDPRLNIEAMIINPDKKGRIIDNISQICSSKISASEKYNCLIKQIENLEKELPEIDGMVKMYQDMAETCYK